MAGPWYYFQMDATVIASALERPAPRIPFFASVGCGFGGICFAQNISKTGLYLEALKEPSSSAVKPGMDISLLISPFGSLPSVQVSGKVARLAETTLEDGRPAIGFGVEFKGLPNDEMEVLEKCVNGWIQRSQAEASETAILWAREALTTPAGARFLNNLDPRSRSRLETVMKGVRDNVVDWAAGLSVVTELNLRTMVESVRNSDVAEKKLTHEKLRSHITAIDHELTSCLGKLSATDHALRKQIMMASSRLSSVWREVVPLLMSEPILRVVTSEKPRDPIMDQCLPESVYENFMRKRVDSAVLDEKDQAELSKLLDRWRREVRENVALPRDAFDLLDRARALALKISFEMRRIWSLRPLAQSASAVRSVYCVSATAAHKLGEELRIKFENAPRGELRDQLLCLNRARAHLAQVVREFEGFVAKLPLTTKEAAKFYERESFGPTEEPSLKTQRRKLRLTSQQKSVLRVVGIFAVVGCVLYYSGDVWRWSKFKILGGYYGRALGVAPSHLDGNTWVGRVILDEWQKIPKEVRQAKGNDLAQKLVDEGYDGLRVETYDGRVVGATAIANGSVTWMLMNVP